jgi:hypothetical protein
MAHTAMITEIATTRSPAYVVDQERLLPQEGGYFNDNCHQTEKGSTKFVENIIKTILDRFLAAAA